MNQELLADRPVGNVNWNRYAKQTVDPRRRLKFPTRLNLMTQEHDEFQRALQLYKKAKLIIEGRMTPNNIKQQLYSTLLQLDRLLPAATRLTMQMIEPFRVSMQDANEIKNLKTSLNAFMLNQEKQKYAWQIDFSKLFEGYTQRLIGQVAVYSTNNRRIPRTLMPGFRNKVSRLMPLYLEPDIVAEFGGEKIILDSKYKSYFFPRNKESKLDQRQRLRSDIHQIIAYTSLEKAKIAIILAPVEENQIIEEMVKYGDIIVGTLGIPLQYEHAHQYSETIRNYFKKVTNLLA
ncbi:Hypothetical protein ADU73_0953 [Pediococcus damnosus]|uniref:5-methylcytosine restriction system specificity protein McrC n=1 Tax=Pediococcus damnosus TaxID=51663 RepID=UPI00078E651C|nr:hypothetical protein [Pediococcus damnosus]AMV69359.1 Hypothetical protein ADU73_0953 [Pediococcus damnosus]